MISAGGSAVHVGYGKRNGNGDMAATYEQLIAVRMSEAQARLLAGELRRERTRDPMAVAVVATVTGVSLTALFGCLAWLALSVTDLRTEVALFQERQIRMEKKIDALADEMAEIKALIAELLP